MKETWILGQIKKKQLKEMCNLTQFESKTYQKNLHRKDERVLIGFEPLLCRL